MIFKVKTSLSLILLSAVLLFVQTSFAQISNGPSVASQESKSKSLRLFIIGNSFSQNAAKYLPQLAKESDYNLEIGRAELGGCSLQRHWEIVEAAEANPNDPKGKQYKGKSLRMLLSSGKWDVVTIQQYSRLSSDVETFRPYAKKLYDYIKSIQPDAKIVIHQTWAYRSDAKVFGLIDKAVEAQDSEEMYKSSRASYYTIAKELDIDVIPTGDAFWKISSNRKWAYKKDPAFNFTNPVFPELPNQLNSLNVGYQWNKENKFTFDPNHANVAGEYLGSLVWYKSLFGESPAKLNFIPAGIPKDFAKQLKKVAATTSPSFADYDK